jgi:hypothetical protein
MGLRTDVLSSYRRRVRLEDIEEMACTVMLITMKVPRMIHTVAMI